MKDSDIAEKVASDVTLSAETVDTGVKLDYVLQHNQTDMEFLQERARRIGYEIVVDDKKLSFRPPRLTEAPVATLSPTDGLIEFSPRLTTMRQVSDVEVRGWDPKNKEAIVGKAGSGKIDAKMGGQKVGAQTSKAAFGAATAGTIDRPVTSAEEAGKIAAGLINQTALAYVVGEGSTMGNPKIGAGSVVRIEGVGKTFSGEYYIATATHSYRPRLGYRTSFSVRRTAT
jgi:phage protein D